MSENAAPTGDEQLPVVYQGAQMQSPPTPMQSSTAPMQSSTAWMQTPVPRYYVYSPYQLSGNPYVLDAVPVPSAGSGDRKYRRAGWTVAGLGVVAVGAAVALTLTPSPTVQGIGSAAAVVAGSNSSGSGSNNAGGSANGGGSAAGGSTSSGTATDAQSVGVVDIVTTLGYQNAQAAGTGTIITSNGEILTNNHVVEGATKITVTVVSTGKSYSASVVGTSPTQDIAVIQLSNASGLKTASYGSSAGVKVGDSVTGVGNAGGTGGTPSSATGTVTALNQTITATDETGANAETLTGMIEINAPIEAGDSGGPLYNAAGKIIAMDTAAQTNARTGATVSADAIPIDTALSIAKQIESGKATDTIHIGYPSFLGVQIASAQTNFGRNGRNQNGSSAASGVSGALVGGVVTATPAAQAGIVAGDVITAIGSTAVTDRSSLSVALAPYRPGDKTTVTWTDSNGQTHSASVTLIEGAAD
jgi:S1-C subfamily serine protease